MSFVTGSIAVLKTTGEKVVVLNTSQVVGQPPVVSVRRPVDTKECGLQHVENSFYEFELETFEQQLDRRLEEAKYVDAAEARLREEAKAAAMAPAKQNLSIN